MPSPTNCPLDHAVISVRDRIDEAASIFTRMGFTLTERSFHSAGSCNHLMVFEQDYFELIGWPPSGQAIRPDLLDAPIGLDGLVLRTDDAHGVHRELATKGLPVSAPETLARKVRLPGGQAEEEARFTTVRFPRGALAGGRVYYCQHETPHLVWHPPFQSHRNGARAIVKFTIVVPAPMQEMAQYERILGVPAVVCTPACARITLGHAELELITAQTLAADLGPLACAPIDSAGRPLADYMAMLTIKVQDLHRAEQVVRDGGFATTRLTRDTQASMAVPAGETMHCTIAFVE
ncbi:MAG: VOC family protein [Betaproteobacteria bacterium]|nr:VOC family protein [Betaproteobacteria bacterium]